MKKNALEHSAIAILQELYVNNSTYQKRIKYLITTCNMAPKSFFSLIREDGGKEKLKHYLDNIESIETKAWVRSCTGPSIARAHTI